MKAWLSHHRQSASLAWRRLAATPVNSLLSLLAIGIALALPAGGQMLLSAARQLAGTATATPQISIFMGNTVDRAMANDMRSRLEKQAGVKRLQFITREETLARMKAGAGLRDVIEALPANPFPDAFVIGVGDERPEAMEKLAAELRKWPGVEQVQLDSAWVRRLDALLKLGRSALLLLASLLGCGLVAISFGIIRMQVLTQHAEIEVSRLLGATEAYIRRPFLYHGSLLGLGGGLVAWLLVTASTLWLRAPMAELAGMYEINLALKAPDIVESGLLLVFAAVLGWLGAVFSLRQTIENT
ncbi:MAG: ABC transporter permease [Rhodocyclales bacterium]|nr:ABC transporter permease [Rhodocyclales bacterium]